MFVGPENGQSTKPRTTYTRLLETKFKMFLENQWESSSWYLLLPLLFIVNSGHCVFWLVRFSQEKMWFLMRNIQVSLHILTTVYLSTILCGEIIQDLNQGSTDRIVLANFEGF